MCWSIHIPKKNTLEGGKTNRGGVKMDFIVENALNNAPEQDFESMNQANIKVIGVGGAGNNMVGWLYKKGIKGAEIIATNTDHQHLGITGADRKFLKIGRASCRERG